MPATPAKKDSLPPGAVVVKDIPPDAIVVSEQPPAEDKTIFTKAKERFLGTDVRSTPLDIPRMATTIGGAGSGFIAGGKIGAALGAATGPAAPVAVPVFGAVGALTGGGVGAFVGASAPEAAIEASEFIGFLPEGSRDEVGLTPDELQTVREGELLIELATGGGLSVIRAGGRASAGILTGARREIAEAAARLGVDMMPVVAGDRVIGRGFVTVFGRFPFLGGGTIRAVGKRAERAFEATAKGLSGRIAPLMEGTELGRRIFADAETLVKDVSKFMGDRYTALWARAEEAGIQVIPRETLAKADSILENIEKTRGAFIEGDAPTGEIVEVVEDFIKKHILPMRAVTEEGVGVTAKQSFLAMDALTSNIDQALAKLAPGERRFADSLFKQLRLAVGKDAIENVRGIGAVKIAEEMKALDNEFSQLMSQLFETSGAKMFGAVKKRGLRGLGFDRSTRIPVDQLARQVIKLDSPQAMHELSKLVTPETYQRIVAHVVDDAMSAAMKTEGFVGQMDIGVFARRLGLDGANASRRKAVAEMLKVSGSPVTMRMLDDIVLVGQRMADFDIPNVSSFIARRATLGGVQAMINGIVPGLALLGGAGATAWSAGAAIGTIMFIGGSHLFARVIANPNSARALHQVFAKEITDVARRQAAIRAIGGGLEAMLEEGEIEEGVFNRLLNAAQNTIDQLDKQFTATAKRVTGG